MESFARNVIRFRWPILLLILALTGFFAWQCMYVRFRITLSDLWPVAHPFLAVHRTYGDQYGSPLTVFIMVRARTGTIYDRPSLEKIARITAALDAIPGVNHDQVVSLTSRKVKTITQRGSSVAVENLVPRALPSSTAEWERFRRDTAAAGVVGTLVSFDGTSSLIRGDFIEARTALADVFARLQAIQAAETGERHEVLLFGEPVLMGWVWTYQREILGILAASLLVTFAMLYFYIRNVHLTLLPILATAVSTIWGLGFVGWLRYTLDPLIILIPALLMARGLSHGIQKIVRIFELVDDDLDATAKARMLILALFASGGLGIMTDVLGLLVIAVSSIPVMQHLAVFCGFWAATFLLTVLILIPVVIAIFGLPPSWRLRERAESRLTTAPIEAIAHLVTGPRARWVVLGAAVVTLGAFALSTRVSIGDRTAGTVLLGPDSPYNRASAAINANFVGTDELYVIARLRTPEAAAAGDGDRSAAVLGVRQVPILARIDDFQRYVERHPRVRRTFSYADFFPVLNRRMHGNEVKWEQLPDTNEAAAQLSNVLLRGTAPGDFRRFVDDRYRHTNVIVWLEDHRGETLADVVGWIQRYALAAPDSPVVFELASGPAGVRAATNAEVQQKQVLVFLLATAIIGTACFAAFRSLWAAAILTIPCVATNFVVSAIMVLMNVGLDVNTLPIISVGIGVGIDYGIYTLTRILQEIRRLGDFDRAIEVAIRTTGRAVFFTATVMIACVGMWYFVSSFRFMAEMGALLALVLAVNLLGALLVIPALVSVFRPRFALTARLLVWD
ncbi:MAG: RND family transporter [Candidatus Binatia bacterium]